MFGTVDHINPRKGFGFILSDEGLAVFFHFSKIEGNKRLNKGDHVNFEITPSFKKRGKYEAIHIELIEKYEAKLSLGIVEWFNNEKGFGIAKTLSKKEVFLHKSGFENPIHLREGDLVQFELADERGKEKAFKIAKVIIDRNNLFCLNDKIESLPSVLSAFSIATNEEKKKILSQQIHSDVSIEILVGYIKELRDKAPENLIEEIYDLLSVLNGPDDPGYRMKQISKVLVDFLIDNSSEEERLTFWINGPYSEEFFSDSLLEYIESNIGLIPEGKIEKILAKKQSKVNRIIFKKKLLRYFPIENNTNYLAAKEILDLIKFIHGNYLGIGDFAMKHANSHYQYEFLSEGYCHIVNCDIPVIYRQFQKESKSGQRDILNILSEEKQYELMSAHLEAVGPIENESEYVEAKALLEKRYSSIYKDYPKIVQLALPFFSPHFRFALWMDGITEDFERYYVLNHFKEFSDEQLMKIIDEKNERINETIIKWKLSQIIEATFNKENLKFIQDYLQYLNDEKSKKRIIQGLAVELDPLYRFFFWLNGELENDDEICRIYESKKEELGEEECQKALQKNFAPLNQLIITDLAGQVEMGIDVGPEGFSHIISAYRSLWLYDTTDPDALLNRLFQIVPVNKIFDFGFEIIGALAQKYSYYSHRGKTFLNILLDAPEHIASTNATYRQASVFYHEGVPLTEKVLARKVEHLKRLMAHLYLLQHHDAITAQFKQEDLKAQVKMLYSIKRFEDALRAIEEDFPIEYTYQFEGLLEKLLNEGQDMRKPVLLWLAGLCERPGISHLLDVYPILEEEEKRKIVEEINDLIPLKKQRSDSREREKMANYSLVENFFDSYMEIGKVLASEEIEDARPIPLEKRKPEIESYFLRVFPINNEKAFLRAQRLLLLIQALEDSFYRLIEIRCNGFQEFPIEQLPHISDFSTPIYQNSLTPYNVKFWVRGLIDEFDYHSYCNFAFVLTTKEKREFNKKARAAMGEAIKTSMLKKREPWELVREGEEGINIYAATWKSIWFMDGEIRVCISSEPEFSHPYAWDFSEEEMNFLYDYISGKRLSPLTIQARGKLILEIDGLDELEEVVYKAELEREIKTGKKRERGEGGGRIPINMILRNKCIQYLNLLQLEGLEPTRLLEKSYNPERGSLSVDLSLLFSIPLPTGEVALIWESLELEKAKATHVFKCFASEHEDIQNQVEDYLSRKDKVRSSLNSNAPADLSAQRRLRYHGRVDHDNFDFAVWQERLHSLLPEMEPVELLEQE